jgi:TRAP-type C4-dicarboxylate transport system permease small subunit
MSVMQTLYKAMCKLSDRVQKILEFILVLLVASCAADLLLQVVYRFVLVKFVSFACTWTAEYAQDALIWITYFAVGICYKENSMASVNLIYDRLKGRQRLALYYVTRGIVLIFLGFGLRYGWAAIMAVNGWSSTNLHLPGYLLFSAPFVGCVLMLYETLTELVGVWSGALEPFVGRPQVEEERELTEQEKAVLETIREKG